MTTRRTSIDPSIIRAMHTNPENVINSNGTLPEHRVNYAFMYGGGCPGVVRSTEGGWLVAYIGHGDIVFTDADPGVKSEDIAAFEQSLVS